MDEEDSVIADRTHPRRPVSMAAQITRDQNNSMLATANDSRHEMIDKQRSTSRDVPPATASSNLEQPHSGLLPSINKKR